MARPPFVPTQMASVVKKGAAEVHLNVVGNESFSSLFNSIKSGVQTGVKSAVKAGRHTIFFSFKVQFHIFLMTQTHQSIILTYQIVIGILKEFFLLKIC